MDFWISKEIFDWLRKCKTLPYNGNESMEQEKGFL